jgi:hypothetical protein
LRFSQRWLWRVSSSGIWCRVVWFLSSLPIEENYVAFEVFTTSYPRRWYSLEILVTILNSLQTQFVKSFARSYSALLSYKKPWYRRRWQNGFNIIWSNNTFVNTGTWAPIQHPYIYENNALLWYWQNIIKMKSIVFWDITPCSPLRFNRRFGGTYHLHLQGRRNKFSKNQQASRFFCLRVCSCKQVPGATCLLAGLLNLFLRPWRWRRYVPPRRRLKLNGLHGAISQKIILFITTAVKTSNPI